ncbi:MULTISPECIES: hypothetical protein [Streptomyces]|uniref:Uncharacterized protein n=1 Tax=Streptomyces lasalocidi TaxID=324833 RepID=A0A4U5W426_STRLS|nr:hypothetical protein [Streptomyces lasalocidi]TKS96183.1 hypothetical protein E4U91_36225 [Streptomyces lasalocidi]
MSSGLVTRLQLTLMGIEACWAGFGACAGFVLGGWWGLVMGAGAAVAVAEMCRFFYRPHLPESTQERLQEPLLTAEAKGLAEEQADLSLVLIMVYKAVMFPLTPGGVSEAEQAAHRALAYRAAAYEGLPASVRVPAAAALEVIDEGLDEDRTVAALGALIRAVYDLRKL